MLLYAASLILGIAILVWGADRMVDGAAVTARNMGVSPMLVGLTIVGFATSAPEIVVSIMAALDGVPNLAIGNAIGSNIANIGLVGGATALLWPLRVESPTLRREFPAMIAVSIIPFLMILDENNSLGRFEGLALMALFCGFFYWLVKLGLSTRGHDSIEAEYASEIPANMNQKQAWLWIFAGLALLIVGSKALVWGAENIALALSISNTVLGITVVAIGTSLPELAVSILAARKGEQGLAFGNVIGSNIFNMLAVIGIAAAIQPTTLDQETLRLHFPVMLAFTVALYFLAYNHRGILTINRGTGFLLLAGFITYHAVVAVQTF